MSDRELEREMSLTKTKVHTTGSPISTATTLTNETHVVSLDDPVLPP